MNKVLTFLVSGLFALSMISACSDNTVFISNIPIENTKISKLDASEIPVFDKRKLGMLNIPTNTINEQKNKQLKLHQYFFKSYANGASSYSISDNNQHLQMLNKASIAMNVKIDTNNDGYISFDEISTFVTSDAYIKYFRENWIAFSFNKLDTNQDKKLSVDEYNKFNTLVKSPELPDFQLLEEFSEYDYNSSRNLEIEEYEDFFMKYLMKKYGIN